MGYIFGLKKSFLTPKQVVPYLGFLVDSVRPFLILLTEEKRQKCLSLTRHVFGSSSRDVKTRQRSSGKFMSFALAVPRVRFFNNEISALLTQFLFRVL